jgi:WD40 repeat protein
MSVKGVCFNKDGTKFLSSSADKTINMYSFKEILETQEE